jgi:hypothetical protein
MADPEALEVETITAEVWDERKATLLAIVQA